MMHRRRCLAALASAAAALPAVALATPRSFGAGRSPMTTSSQRLLMGTRVDMIVAAVPPALAEEAQAKAWSRMEALAWEMSRYEAGNSLAQLAERAGGGQVLPVSLELGDVLGAALQRARDTGGLYDPTVGRYKDWDFRPGHEREASADALRAQRDLQGWRHLHLDARRTQARLDKAGLQLDLGGVAKLPILQAGLQVLREHGITQALLNGGGDVLTLGQAAPDRAWRVAVRDPRQPTRWLGVVDMPRHGAVLAASGDYERSFQGRVRRCHHILDPRTGEPSQGLHGLALLADSVGAVNAWGPAMMVAGPTRARQWGRHLAGVELLLAGPGEGQGRESLWMSQGWQQRLHRA